MDKILGELEVEQELKTDQQDMETSFIDGASGKGGFQQQQQQQHHVMDGTMFKGVQQQQQQQQGWKSKIKNFKFPWNKSSNGNVNSCSLKSSAMGFGIKNDPKSLKQQDNKEDMQVDDSETQVISLDDVSLQTQQLQTMKTDRRILMNYEILDTLGKGMSGKVKRGRHVQHGGLVALKIIDKATAKKRTLQLLHTEIVVMRSLSHPNILDLYEVNLECRYPKRDGSKTRDVMVLALQLAEGGEIFDFMMYGGAFKEIVARTYFKQLCSALELCHTHGIYHRDIKPENLLLDGHFQLKVADFGLAAMRSSPEYLLRTECGTRTYMAPEILARRQYDGAKGDVWAAGIVLFIMLAGNPPFTIARSTDWWFHAIQEGDYDKFWKAHKRYAPFPVGAIPLINQIFQIDFRKRASVTKILQNPWMQEPSLTPQELYEIMYQKKIEVTQKKQAMKEKAKKRKQESAVNTGNNVFDKDTERSTVIDSLRTQEQIKNFEKAPIFHGKAFRGFTQFYTYQYPQEFFNELKTILMHDLSLNGDKITITDKSPFSIKVNIAYKNVDNENSQEENRKELACKINIYKSPDEDDDNDCNIVIFERIMGDVFLFYKFFKCMKGKLSGDDDIKDNDFDNENYNALIVNDHINDFSPPKSPINDEDLPDLSEELDMI